MTVVVPTGNNTGALFVTDGVGPVMSKTVGVPSPTGVPKPVASMLTAPGAVIDGAVVSRFTVTGSMEVPPLEVAEHVNVIPGVSL